MKTIKLFLFTVTSLISMNVSSQDAREIAERSLNAVNFDAMEMTAVLKIYDQRGNIRERKIAVASKKFRETTKTLIKFLSPADVRGTAMLIYDYENNTDDMWIYLPALRQTRRIVSSEKGKNFMGSEFSNADMSKPNMDDFTYRISGTDQFNSLLCWKIESTCKNENIEAENGFSSKVTYIEKGNYLPHKMEYYDKSGDLFKVITMGDYRKQGKESYFAFSMNAENHRNNRRSEMIVDEFQSGSDLDENSFSTTSLER